MGGEGVDPATLDHFIAKPIGLKKVIFDLIVHCTLQWCTKKRFLENNFLNGNLYYIKINLI